MERTFEVSGIAKAVLIFRGMAIQPKQAVSLRMTEKEYNCFKDYINITNCKEILPNEPQKSAPIIETPKQEEKPKGETQDVRKPSTSTARNKRQNKK